MSSSRLSLAIALTEYYVQHDSQPQQLKEFLALRRAMSGAPEKSKVEDAIFALLQCSAEPNQELIKHLKVVFKQERMLEKRS